MKADLTKAEFRGLPAALIGMMFLANKLFGEHIAQCNASKAR